MHLSARMRGLTLSLVVVIALVAVAVPTCRMVGCDMDMGAMPFVPFSGAHLTSDCGGEWAFSSTPVGTLPSSALNLLLSLAAAMVAALVLFGPQLASRPLLAMVSNPPPPPELPRGERFRV
ncbi:MAG: hypothetical protein HGB10_05295 [Coriobacteriia bacterium]|nr:hypothetical protein [Coriobacteriia bacterium]